ncbi:MAG: hypothetical protein ACKOA2_10245 [Ilumatobacteraceae bacterium]
MEQVETRRPAVDVARLGALALVVVGHLLLAVVDRPGGEIRGDNLIALAPAWEPLAALSPMPVFFAAAGFAHATGSFARTARRLRTLAGLALVVVGGWSVAVVGTVLITGSPGIVGDGARLATQPLWFVALYAPLAAVGGRLGRLTPRHLIAGAAACLAAMAALDVVRFGLGVPDDWAWLGWLGFAPAWAVPWLLGTWWRTARIDERRVGAVVAIVAGVIATALVRWFGYGPALIDAIDGQRSNTTPPTLYTAVVGVAQFGVLLVVAQRLDDIGRRHDLRRPAAAALGVYVWHLTALALCIALLALGVPAPTRFSGTWWWTRPLWWAAVLGLTAALVAATRAVGARRGRRAEVDTVDAHAIGANTIGVAPAVGVVVLGLAAAGIGLEGPRSVATAVGLTAATTTAWFLLGRGTTSRTPTSE